MALDTGLGGPLTAPVAFLASMGHYGAHLAPTWAALPPDLRGGFWCGAEIREELERQGVDRGDLRAGLPPPGTLTVVASAGDAIAAKRCPTVLVEHGAGQVYDIDNPSYSGGAKRDGVVLFLCPNDVSGGRNRARYPEAVVEVVGSPRLDTLMAQSFESELAYAASRPLPDCDCLAKIKGLPPAWWRDPHQRPQTVALSHHWDCQMTPESRWAQPHFWRAYPDLVERFDVVGHGHPRYRAVFADNWRRLGIEHVERFEQLLGRAWVYVCDNSSSLYEWAAVGRPVVVLNAPWYRRDVDLWPRFWRCADVGVQVNEPDELAAAVALALTDPSDIAARRAEVVDEVFPLRDGRAAQRSAYAIAEVAARVPSLR